MKYLDLLEQIELVEAAKDKYAPMFSFFDQIAPGLEHPQTFRKMIDENIDWATRTLSNSDRIVWYLRYVRMYVLHWTLKELKTLGNAYVSHDPAKSGQPKLTDDPKAEETFYGWMRDSMKHNFPETEFRKLPPIGKKSMLSRYIMFSGLPVPSNLWQQADAEVEQFKANIEGIIQLAEKLLTRDLAKMNKKMPQDVGAYLKEVEPKYEALKAKHRELQKVCYDDPEHTDCGNTLEELESRTFLLESIYRVASDYVEDNTNVIKSMMSDIHGHILRMQQQLSHYESINYEPMKELQFGWKPWGMVAGILGLLEEYWANKAKRVVAHDSYYEKPQIEKIMDFGNGMAWFNLHRSYCDVEGKAMGHCGNEYDNMREADEVLSLREYIGKNEQGYEEWKPHLTFIFDTERGKLSEMKGYKNNKPEAKYHRYIIPLLEQDWVEGIYTRRGQHEKENNFFISDLPEEIARRLAEEKPALVTRIDMEKLGVEGEPEQEEEDPTQWNMDQINEQLDEWGIENIEEMDENIIVLSSLGDTEKAYEELSGENWPSSSDVDYIDPEQAEHVKENFSNSLLSEIIEYVVYEYTEDAADAAEFQPDEDDEDFDQEEYLEELEQNLDAHDAMNILDETNDTILDQAIQSAWEDYHVEDMQSEAENLIDQYANEYIQNRAEITWLGNKYAITIDKNIFFDEVWDDLENEASGYGTTYWSRIFNAHVPGVGEGYWEGFIYGDPDYAYDQIARKAESEIEDTLHQEKYRRKVNKMRDEDFKRRAEQEKADLIQDKTNLEAGE